jgi:hypothetical protein
MSAAEEGEATPLMASNPVLGEGTWYQGPLFTAGVKLALLFMVFGAVVVGTFYYGLPGVDPLVHSIQSVSESKLIV